MHVCVWPWLPWLRVFWFIPDDARLRKNTFIRVVDDDFKLPNGSTALSDQMVLINWYNTKRTESCFRLVKVEDTKGNVLQLIINRFDLSADEISEMYKSRWPLNYFSNGWSNMWTPKNSTVKVNHQYTISCLLRLSHFVYMYSFK